MVSIVAFTSHRINSVVLLMLMLLIKAAIICLSTTVILVVAIHYGIRHTARTLVVIHNLRFVILKLIEVGHTTAHSRDFLAAWVVVALAMLFPL